MSSCLSRVRFFASSCHCPTSDCGRRRASPRARARAARGRAAEPLLGRGACEHEREQLDRLAEAHLLGEHAAAARGRAAERHAAMLDVRLAAAGALSAHARCGAAPRSVSSVQNWSASVGARTSPREHPRDALALVQPQLQLRAGLKRLAACSAVRACGATSSGTDASRAMPATESRRVASSSPAPIALADAGGAARRPRATASAARRPRRRRRRRRRRRLERAEHPGERASRSTRRRSARAKRLGLPRQLGVQVRDRAAPLSASAGFAAALRTRPRRRPRAGGARTRRRRGDQARRSSTA